MQPVTNVTMKVTYRSCVQFESESLSDYETISYKKSYNDHCKDGLPTLA
jgi:hypothetical protein